jgi:hypothetical protein
VETAYWASIRTQHVDDLYPVQMREGQKTNVVPVERPEKDKNKLFYGVKND